DEGQAQQLSTLLCDEGQGFFFARPQPAAELRTLFTPQSKVVSDDGALPPLDVAVVEDHRVLEDLAADIGALHAELGVPVHARLRWLQVWASLETSWTPWAVLVRERESGRLSGVALLARRQVDDGHEVVPMGHGPFGTTRFAARDLLSANVLARASADQITELAGRWMVTLGNLDQDDLVGQLLLQLLPNACATPVARVPFVDLAAIRDGAEPYTHNMRRQLRKAENRLATDGLRAELQFARTDPEIRLLLPHLDRIHIERDHAAGRVSDLDNPHVRELWRRLILAHTVGGQIEFATLGIHDAIVAYVVGIRDDKTYRVFDGHFDTQWARYSPGRLIEHAVLQHLVADHHYESVDWMLGVASEKILVTTGARKELILRAASTPAETQEAPALVGSSAIL
ncbi:MAG: GNAT family N-acetyltransferase, partial [Ilumatobacteraceae bacterium]